MKVKKKLPYFAGWEVKRCVDKVFAERSSTSICFPEVSSAGTFEIFSRCFAGIFFVFFCCCFSVFFFVFVFCLFVFVPCGKSSVSSYDVLVVFVFFFNFLLGCLLYSGCSFTCSGLTNVVFKGIFGGFFFLRRG